MNLIEIFSIIIIHWFADFVIQTDKQAKGKSKNLSDLLSHTVTYSLFWFFSLIIIGLIGWIPNPNLYNFYSPSMLISFVGITFICHTITDYFTSRLNSKLWEQGKVHNFFVSVGFDQVLHYIQLFTTYWLLTR